MVEANARALVLGGGGVLGFAWTLGALSSLQTEWGVKPADAGLLVGTSAGSILAALISCGIDVDVLMRHQQGLPAPADPNLEWNYDGDSGGAVPPRPGLRPGSPRLLIESMLHPKGRSATLALSGILPRGRGTLGPIHDVVAQASVQGLPGLNWPQHPHTWIVATDYDSGARAVFGRDDIPVALADAVTASCAIPAWYAPVEIGGRNFIDGGTASNASADLVVPLVQDGSITEVFVLAPMASVEMDRPRSPVVRLERVVRRVITRGILADVDRLRAAGARVTMLTPGPHDLDVIGANLMNPARRAEVLRTSLLTSAGELRQLRIRQDVEDRDVEDRDVKSRDEEDLNLKDVHLAGVVEDDAGAAPTGGVGQRGRDSAWTGEADG